MSSGKEMTATARKRLLLDLRRLEAEPIPLASARPRGDDLSLWNGVIGVEMEVSDFGMMTVPLHFLIDFPSDYPQSAPNIGFSFEFPYSGGASYVQKDGRLKGKKVICLDILGNFAHVHTEWKSQQGTGWTAAYTVTTLLVQLQSVLCDVGVRMSQADRNRTFQLATRFCEKNPTSVLEIFSQDEINDRREARQAASRFMAACGGDAALAQRAETFAQRFVDDPEGAAEFLALLTAVAVKVGSCVGSEEATQPGPATGSNADQPPECDANICCFAMGKLYTEALLGVGVNRKQKNLTTQGELLSWEAYGNGVHQGTDKTPFEWFLPVWINEKHASSNQEWCETLRKSYMRIAEKAFDIYHEVVVTTEFASNSKEKLALKEGLRGWVSKVDSNGDFLIDFDGFEKKQWVFKRNQDKLREVKSEDDAIVEVFARLINQMIVEMMRPDQEKTEAIATFEALCNFWRTLRWLVETRPSLRERTRRQLEGFVKSEALRHKDTTPDLGMALALYTVYQGLEGCPSQQEFIDAYADENFVRCVMWWQRAGIEPKPAPVFQETKISREICMFQCMVTNIVIGNAQETLVEMEATNCKVPLRLERLQKLWREQKASTDSWELYFERIGASQPKFPSLGGWINDCVKRAAQKGPKYGGGKGGSKGGKGKSGKGGGYK